MDINISTKVTEITETVSKEEVSKAETELDNIIKDIAVSPKQKKIEYFDISMRKNIKTGNNEVKSSEIKDTKKFLVNPEGTFRASSESSSSTVTSFFV